MIKKAYSKNNVLIHLDYKNNGCAYIGIDIEPIGLRDKIEKNLI